MRLGELLGELLLRERRRLLLEAHLLDLRARGLELLLGGEPRFLGRAQLGAEALQPVARRGQRLLGLAARRELALQRLLDRRPVDRRALGRELGEQAALLRDLRRERLAPPLELGQALAAAALGERPPPAPRARRRARARGRARTRPRLRCCACRAASRCAASSCSCDCASASSRASASRLRPARRASCAARSASSATICARRFSAASAACFSCRSSSSRSWQRRCCDENAMLSRVVAPLRRVELGLDRGQRVARGARGLRARRRWRARARRARAGGRARRAVRCRARRSGSTAR